eukprot:TRINITY_DN5658_c0_g2_i1.p1 TRINITY_DN5658_c0_g2~~TRINITY_DN5658_c0_g2_i1.p1  ORF type:complete len:262 (+),score=62.96 TRINITY_DN5658_c0_g2_i1:22-786(+)
MAPTLLQSFPSVLSNVHDYFIYVAAQVENLHQRVQSMRCAYLADQCRRGDENDPFLEADRREFAKREAAARRVHPALNVSIFSQPSTQAAGLFSSSAAPVPSLAGMQQSSQPTPGGLSATTPGTGFSLFGTPTPSTSSSSFGSTGTTSLFGTPSSMFGTNTSSSLFPSTMGSSTPSSFSTPALGSTSTGILVASTGASTSLFGAPTSSSGLFGSSQASGSFFNTTSSFGPGTSSGSNFGAASKSTRPKSRTPRR